MIFNYGGNTIYFIWYFYVMEDSSIRVLLVKKKALEIIYTFPVSKNGNHFLRIKDGRKLFFSIFIKKYGLD